MFPDPFGAATRYVLYDDGAFALQFSSMPDHFFEYLGSYTETQGTIDFRFQANEGAWWATGTVDQQSLEVGYNTDMSLSDFTNGIYLRVR